MFAWMSLVELFADVEKTSAEWNRNTSRFRLHYDHRVVQDGVVVSYCLSSVPRCLQCARIARAASVGTDYKSSVGTTWPRPLVGRERSRGMDGPGGGLPSERSGSTTSPARHQLSHPGRRRHAHFRWCRRLFSIADQSAAAGTIVRHGEVHAKQLSVYHEWRRFPASPRSAALRYRRRWQLAGGFLLPDCSAPPARAFRRLLQLAKPMECARSPVPVRGAARADTLQWENDVLGATVEPHDIRLDGVIGPR